MVFFRKKKRLIGKDFRVIQTRGNHNLFLVHSVDCEGPGKMTDSGPSVAVLGVTCVEPHVYGKGLILGLVLQKFDSAVDDQFGLVAQTAVFLPFVKGISSRSFQKRQSGPPPSTPWASSHATFPQNPFYSPHPSDNRRELFHRFGLGLVMVAVHPESPPRQTTEDGSPADPANGLTDESVGKPSSPSGQTVDIGCLGQGMTSNRGSSKSGHR